MRGRGFPQADLVGLASESDAIADRLTEQQGLLLDVSKLIRRMEIRGGAGSGKTWLAMEQTRRLQRAGERVALVCYSRGLAAYFSRVTSPVAASRAAGIRRHLPRSWHRGVGSLAVPSRRRGQRLLG